ncbi:hydroxymethylpyrimidine/phosphomethylpyrimidine kinase [Ensifer soli]|uniref:hydroxymethylpyrimidine/phosphomethylpyrimidine kinase n=1 Tax=Ciceribacter sp. sgz301302 TaxID=3342379 RepID=UPI0035B6F05C
MATVLIVAGSDSSGGAGIARDVATVAKAGGEAALALTAVTVQTHRAVEAIEAMPPALVAAQMRAAFDSGPVGAVKIGMLANGPILVAVADVLAAHAEVPVVLDPVLAASAGGALLSEEAMMLLRQVLLPRVTLVTPNLPELARLTGTAEIADVETGRAAAMMLNPAGAVLVKGGHAAGDTADDLLLRPGLPDIVFRAARSGARLRGTGCMLSSGIAARLALGDALETAIRGAKAQVTARFADAA